MGAGVGDAHASQGGGHGTDGAVIVEEKGIYPGRAQFVELGRVVVMVIEQVPLAFVFHDRVVIGPAARGRLLHDYALERVGTHGMVAHGVGQGLGLVLHPRESEVVFPLALESEGSFLETLRQAFHHLRLGIQLHQVVFQPGHAQAAACPEDVSLAVAGLQNARVYAVDSRYRLVHGRERPRGTLAGGHAHGEAPSLLRRGREVEIVSAVLVDTVWRPHGVGVGLHPRHVVLVHYHAMVCPVHQVLGGEHMVIRHGKPFPLRLHGAHDVMGGVEIHLALEHAGRRIGGKLVVDNGILRLRQAGEQQPKGYRP